jgi:hypothetical protein
MLHMHLVDVIHGLGYTPGDCMGTHLPDGNLPSRAITLRGGAPGPLYQRVDGMWHRLDPAQGTVTVAAGTPVLLRIGSDDPVTCLHWAGAEAMTCRRYAWRATTVSTTTPSATSVV